MSFVSEPASTSASRMLPKALRKATFKLPDRKRRRIGEPTMTFKADFWNNNIPLYCLFLAISVLAVFFYGKSLYVYTRTKKLTQEQIKLRATLIGTLANIVLGAAIVSVLLKMTGDFPRDLTWEIMKRILNYAFTILASISVWCILHKYALSLLEKESTSQKDLKEVVGGGAPTLGSSLSTIVIAFALLATFSRLRRM